jgi:hypothetical protein
MNAQPSDPKACICLDHAQSWDSYDDHGWDARLLPGDLKTCYAHLAHLAQLAHLAPFTRYACNIPGTQDEASRLIEDILTPIPIDLKSLDLMS